MTRTVIVTAVIAATLAVAAAFSPGCEPTTEYKGRRVTEAQLAEAVTRDIADAEAVARKKAEAAAAAEAAEVHRLEREAQERTRAFERQLSRMVAEQQFELEDLRDMFDQSALQITDAIEAARASGQAQRTAAAEEFGGIRAAADRARADGLADLDRQWSGRGVIAGVLETGVEIAKGVPGWGDGLGLLVGALGGTGAITAALGLRRKNQQLAVVQQQEAAAADRAGKLREALGALSEVAAMLPKDIRKAIATELKRMPDEDQAVLKEVRREDTLHALEQQVDNGELRLAA